MIRVEGGSFQMGSPEDAPEASSWEKPQHWVTLNDYYIGETQVTQELWKAVMGDNSTNYYWEGDNMPVVGVSWNDCQEFIKKLNKKISKTKPGITFRLPSEAEWEYAARGGRKSQGFRYAGGNDIDEVAWYDGNSGEKTHPVKQKRGNELGLYDMSGNVWEWCQDWWQESYPSSSQTNSTDPSEGSDRVRRGGGWNCDATFCRAAYRYGDAPTYSSSDLGLRLAL